MEEFTQAQLFGLLVSLMNLTELRPGLRAILFDLDFKSHIYDYI